MAKTERFATLSLRKVSFGEGRRIRYAGCMAAAIDPLTSSASAKHWTYADLLQFDEKERYEIYDGRLIPMSPSPSFYHQEILARLYDVVAAFNRRHQIGRVVFAPLDVIFSDDNTSQPDLLFIAHENSGIVKSHIFGAPDLAAEIISPSGIRRDRYEKLEQYARFGVKEYWIIDPANRSVEILSLADGRYVLHASAAETGTVSSLVLKGLEFEVSQLF